MVKVTWSSDSVEKTIPEPILGLDTDLRQTIFFQFSSFKKVRIRTVPHGVLLEIPWLETGVFKAHWDFHAKSFALFYGTVDIWEQAKQRDSKVSDPFPPQFQFNWLLWCIGLVDHFSDLQPSLITVSETRFSDLNPFWSWRQNFMLLNF